MYQPYEIKISHKYLKTLISSLEEPVCLTGGWAVYRQVNKNFKKATGRDYIGSRDIDLGFHFEKNWSRGDMLNCAFARSLRVLEELSFNQAGFRYLKEFHTETEKELSRAEAKNTLQHFIFPLYIDPIVDIFHPEFQEVFKFNPVDEPLLEMVFVDKAHRITQKLFEKSLWLPKPHVLLATKLKSVVSRDKEHKRLKDIADIFALLWFTDFEIAEIKSNLLEFYDKRKIKQVIDSISKQEIQNVSNITGFKVEEIERILLEISR